MEEQTELIGEEPKPVKQRGPAIGVLKLRKMKVEVTHAIIQSAIPANSSHCIIADAVKKAAVDKKMRVTKVLADLATVRFTDLDSGRRYICLTPQIGQRAIVQFDQGIIPEPFTMTLKPAQVTEKAERAQPPRNGKPGKGPSPAVVVSRKGRATRPLILGGKPLSTSIGLRRDFGVRQLGMQSINV